MYDNCTHDDARSVWAIFDDLADRIRKADCPAGRESVRIDYEGDSGVYCYDDGHVFWRELYSNQDDFTFQVDWAVAAGHLTIVQAVLIKAHAAGMRDYLELNARF